MSHLGQFCEVTPGPSPVTELFLTHTHTHSMTAPTATLWAVRKLLSQSVGVSERQTRGLSGGDRMETGWRSGDAAVPVLHHCCCLWSGLFDLVSDIYAVTCFQWRCLSILAESLSLCITFGKHTPAPSDLRVEQYQLP